MPRSWFAKAQALGNDFIWLLDPVDETSAPDARHYAAGLCDRHEGVGADGLILWNGQSLEPQVWFFNADGSPAETCGNGLRALAVAGRDLHVFTPGLLRFHSGNSCFPVLLGPEGSPPAAGLGVPEFAECPGLEERLGTWGGKGVVVFVPNPHIVVFGDAPVAHRTSLAHELAACVPAGANVGFASIEEGTIMLRVWERGVGWTKACGSGAAAAFAAAQSLHVTSARTVTVRQPGGDLAVWFDEDGRPWIQGGASLVFVGFLGAPSADDAAWASLTRRAGTPADEGIRSPSPEGDHA